MSEPWNPAPYQRRAVKFLLEHAAAGIFADPGLRKTSIVLGALKVLLRERAAKRIVVLAPLRPCYGVWCSDNEESELRKWTDFHELRSVVLHGGQKDKLLDAALRDGTQLFVLNPEGLQWLMTEGRFKRLDPDTLVVDESTMFKNSRTQRFKFLEPILEHFRRRWILTGTPTPNGLLDLFGQVKLLDLGRSLGRYITHYRFRYFNATGFGGYTWTPKDGAEDAIYRQLRDLVLRIDEADAGIDIPKVVDVPMYVQLPKAARIIYDDLETKLLAEVRGETINAVNMASAMTKCAQVANGALYLPQRVDKNGIPIVERTRRYTDIHDAKLEALAELREELSGKPLIATYYFEHDLERIRAYFDADIPAIGGSTSAKETQAIERDWNAKKLPLLLMQPGSVHGLNPQGGGCHLAWFGLTFNYEHYEQTIRRLRRSGQKSSRVWNHLLAAQGTVDEVKLAAMRSKEKGQRALLDALRAYAGRRLIKR